MWRQHSPNATYSANTNIHPAFGNLYKVERNRKLTASVMKLNFGMQSPRTGRKGIETTYDPRKRKPEYILARAREEASIAGRTRARIEARAPGQMMWKYPYWIAQRPPVRQPIGPFTMGSLEQQSILQRIASGFRNFGGQ